MSFIYKLTKIKDIDDILKRIAELMATLDPKYDYTEEGEPKSVFSISKEVASDMVKDTIKELKKKPDELKQALLYFLNEEFKEMVEKDLERGKDRYWSSVEPTPENIDVVINAIRELYSKELVLAEQRHISRIQSEALRYAELNEKQRKKNKWSPKEFDPSDDVELKRINGIFDIYLQLYEQFKGKRYRNSIMINREKEEAEKSIRQDKENSRLARDALLAEKAKQKAEREAIVALKKVKKLTKLQQEQEKYNMSNMPIPSNVPQFPVQEEIDTKPITYNVPVKLKKGLFADIKELVSNIAKEGLKPHLPELHENRDRTGRLLTDEEVAQLKRIRAKLAEKIPKNEIIESESDEEPELVEGEVKPIKKRRGRPPNPNSKRQQKLNAPVKVEEVVEEPKKRGRKPNPESKRQQKLNAPKEVDLDAPPKKRGRPPKKPEEKTRPPKKEGKGRPKKCDNVKPKSNVLVDLNKNKFGEGKKKTITEGDVNNVPYEKVKGTKNMVNVYLLKNTNLTPERFLDVVEDLLKPSGTMIEKTPYLVGKTAYRDKILKRKNNINKLSLYHKICLYIVSHGLVSAYDLEHQLTQRILKDLTENKSLNKLVAFEKYVMKNCIDPKLTTLKEVRQNVEAKKKKEVEIIPYNKITADIKKYTRLFERTFDLNVNTILDIVQDIWSKPKNKNIRINADGKSEVLQEQFNEEDENKVDFVEWEDRALRTISANILIAIEETFNNKELDEYLKDKANRKYLIGKISELLNKLVGDITGGKMKLEKIPRRYK